VLWCWQVLSPIGQDPKHEGAMNSYRTRDELQRLGFSLLDTADYDLLDQPLTNREDVHAIEARPLTERLALENFSTRVDLALASRRPNDIAIH
jgi:hypothetical protein